MKLIIGALAAGATLVPSDLPFAEFDECIIVSVDIETVEPTYIEPSPAATSVQLIVSCGQRVVTSTGNFVNQPSLKVIQLDQDQAEVLVQAAGDLLGDGDVFLSD